MPLSDRELVEACIRGDGRAWEEFVRRVTPYIKGVIRNVLARRGAPVQEPDVEDLAAATFAELLARDKATLRAFGPPYQLKSWLATIATRVCSHQARAADPPAAPLDKAPAPAVRDAAPDESAAILERLLSTLAPEDRALLELFYAQERSYEEISLLLGIPVNSIGKRKFRILKQLEDSPQFVRIRDLLA